ncbi:MAG: sialidase family protein [Stackebrandtia sp.]
MSGMTRRQNLRAAGLTAAGLALVTAVGTSEGTVAHATPTREIAYATVFQRYGDGYHTFRIPAILQAADGTLLAFAEGRVDDPDDNGNVDLVLKRSTDGGATWGPLQVVVNDGTDKFGNPVPILDRDTGRIILNTTRTGGNVDGDDIRCGRANAEETRRSFVQHSDDNGTTWSDPVEITADVRPSNWRHFVGGPGHGIQLSQGSHAGRLVVPGNHSIAPPDGSGLDCLDDRLFGAHCLYSDDGGETWRLGGVDTPLEGTVNPNESIAAELDDGTVYFNARDQHGSSAGTRAATVSGDGGESFDGPYRDVPDLVAPVVQGSVFKLSAEADPQRRLVFSAPGNPDAREDLTLSTSLDEAASWQESLVVYRGPTGYSDLVEIGGSGALGVLYENGDEDSDDPYLPYHQRITFAVVPMEQLDVDDA